jgi:hypothetical protein
LGRTFSFLDGFGDVYYHTTPTDDMNRSDIKMGICPVRYAEKIELRVIWQIWIYSTGYTIYVDAMTGQFIGKNSFIDY